MKKITILIMVLLLFSAFIYCENGNTNTAAVSVTETSNAMPLTASSKDKGPETTQSITGYGWALSVSDVALAGLTVWAIEDYNTQADAYNTLRAQIDNTTEANYWRLMYEKDKVDSRVSNVVIPLATGSVAVLYTIVDYFWLHNAFPVQIKAGYNNAKNETMIQITKEF
jgi:hypothetical protein